MKRGARLLWFVWSLLPLLCSAQYENIWVFGFRNKLDFNSGLPVPGMQDGISMSNSLGPATVCDRQGQLLFYTDGHDIWDRNGALMANGQNITRITGTVHKSISMSLIVPFPDSMDKYYVFSLQGGYGLNNPAVGYGRLYYSVVDMNLNGGFGDVLPGRKGILLDSGLAGRLTAVPGMHCNVWVMVQVHPALSYQFKVFNIAAGGVDPLPVVSPVSNYPSHGNSFEDIAVSPNGRKIGTSVFHFMNVGFEVYDFNPATGVVTNTGLRIARRWHSSLAFSPNSSKVYSHNYDDGRIYQYDLDSTSPLGVRITEDSIPGLMTGMKLAPDGKIYFRSLSSITQLGMIPFPDAPAQACGYQRDAVSLPNNTSEKFPNTVPVIPRDTIYRLREEVVCFADSFILLPDAAGWGFRWDNRDTSRRRAVYNSGRYTVSYYTAPCVYSVDTFDVVFHGKRPEIQTFPGCRNSRNGSIKVRSRSGDTTRYIYVWKDRSGQVIRTHESRDGDSLTDVAAGIYTLVMKDHDCTDSFMVTIQSPDYRIGFTADSIVCQADSIRFHNTSAMDSFNAWLWDFGDGVVSIDANPVHAYAHPGVYTVRLTGVTDYPCYDTFYRTITVDSMPVVFFTIDSDSVCAGTPVRLKTSFAGSISRLSWDIAGVIYPADADGHAHVFDDAGTYSIILTADANHCRDTSFSDTVVVMPYPEVELRGDTAICPGGEAVNLVNLRHHESSYRYEWSTGAVTPGITVYVPGRYWLAVTSDFHCRRADTVVLSKACYLDIPNVFTPNGDGVNDYFFPRFLPESVTKFHMQLFNRWGQLIYETGMYDRGWDGTLNGHAQPGGVYIYRIEVGFRNGVTETYHGNVTLLI